MTLRKLSTLIITAAVMLAVTVFLYSGEEKAPGGFVPGSLLIQGLDPAAVQTIKIKSGDTALELARGGASFRVATKSNYPADTQRVNDLLIAALEIRCAAKITESASNHADLGVAEDSKDAAVVEFLGKDGQRLTGLVRGRNVEGASGQYVRRLGENTVYASGNWISINTSDQQYLDAVLTKLDSPKITRVSIATQNDTYSITQPEENQIVLQDIPDGKQPKGRIYETVFRAGANLRFDNVVPAAEAGVTFDSTYTIEMRSGLKYMIKSAKKDGQAWIALSAEAPRADSQISIAVDESKEELEKKEEIVTAADTAKKFNERHAPWVYEVSSWYAENLTKPLADLLDESYHTGDLKDEADAAAPVPGMFDPAISPADIIMLDDPNQVIDLTGEPAMQPVIAPSLDVPPADALTAPTPIAPEVELPESESHEGHEGHDHSQETPDAPAAPDAPASPSAPMQ